MSVQNLSSTLTMTVSDAVLIDCSVIYLFVFWLLNKGKAAAGADIFLDLTGKPIQNIYRDNIL